MGLVFVLLLGEIDLSAGVAGGVAACVMAILINDKGWGWPLAVLGGVVTGLIIGLLIGLLVSRLGIPSFVVTLAFFLGLQGVTLRLIGEGGTVPVRNSVIVGIANSNLPVVWGWILASRCRCCTPPSSCSACASRSPGTCSTRRSRWCWPGSSGSR